MKNLPLIAILTMPFWVIPVCGQSTVQYASPRGNDLNDGLSWATAKRTIMAAYDALPNLAYKGGGTIYFTEGTPATNIPGCGIWIMGSHDSAYNNPPPCWRKDKSVSFIGVADGTSSPNGHMPVAYINAGSTVDRYHPAIWLSGEGSSINFNNIGFSSQVLRGVVIGEDSTTHSRNGSAVVATVRFFNVHGGATNTAGSGPGWDITGQSFWIWMEHCGFQGSDEVNPPTGDLAPAVLLDGRTNAGVGLITILNSNTANGAIKFYSGGNGGSVTVKTLTSEGLRSPASVWFASNRSIAIQGLVENITTADAASGTVDVENDNTLRPPADVLVIRVSSVKGMAEIYGVDSATDNPLNQQQEGVINGRLLGQNDSARRGFGPVSVRFTNLAAVPIGGKGVTTGVTAPDGTSRNDATGAITFAPAGSAGLTMYSVTQTPHVGDWFVASSWIRANSASGFYSGNHPLYIQIDNAKLAGQNIARGRAYCQPNWTGNQEWMWCYTLAKIMAASSGTSRLSAAADQNHSVSIYCPTFTRIPAGTVSDNEVWEYAQSLQPYAASCSVGTTCNCAGHRF